MVHLVHPLVVVLVLVIVLVISTRDPKAITLLCPHLSSRHAKKPEQSIEGLELLKTKKDRCGSERKSWLHWSVYSDARKREGKP
jgi:hypothetical protein